MLPATPSSARSGEEGRMPTAVSDPRMVALLTGARRAARSWPGLRVEYAWRPPFEGESVTQPNRLEVVFSAHDAVELGHGGPRAHPQRRGGRRLRGRGRAHGAAPRGRVQRHAGDLSRPGAGARRRRRGGGRALRARADARLGADGVLPARRGAARRRAPAAAGGGRAGRAFRHRGEHAGAPAGPAGAGPPVPAARRRRRRRRSIRAPSPGSPRRWRRGSTRR